MFRFDEELKVYLHRDPVDVRMGFNGLSILVEQAMRLNPMTSALFVFGNRRRDRIKIRLGRQRRKRPSSTVVQVVDRGALRRYRMGSTRAVGGSDDATFHGSSSST
ncbi:IS66 family insertion sequence element accessory protein TnpB, partial [Burkholderia seminalis]